MAHNPRRKLMSSVQNDFAALTEPEVANPSSGESVQNAFF